jgi:Raf kinase inhibitor-like YbhB/YbcL family protein
MKLWSDSFKDGETIPGEFAFCVIDTDAPQQHVRVSDNRNPHLAWSDVPPETKSFALICHDPDVPSVGVDVNQEGKTISADLPRVDFFHWCLIDMPPNMVRITPGAFSGGITARGKPGPECLVFMRHAINDYTAWFAADPDMSGDYYGYDGPCPPWNDALLHRYVFTLYALNVPQLSLEGRFDGAAVRAAIAPHVIVEASITGTYSLNPALKP